VSNVIIRDIPVAEIVKYLGTGKKYELYKAQLLWGAPGGECVRFTLVSHDDDDPFKDVPLARDA